MKKIVFLISSFYLFILTSNAQKGTVLLGGSVSIVSTSLPDLGGTNKTTAIEFSPIIGYQFNNNWTAGLASQIISGKSSTSGANGDDKTSIYSAGPFMRYTQTLSNTFAVYGQTNLLFGGYKFTSPSGAASKGSTFNGNLFPAVFVNIKNNFGLNFDFGGIQFTTSKNKASGSESTSSFAFTFGKTVNIGISKNFGNKKNK
jgi:hypothetical protein